MTSTVFGIAAIAVYSVIIFGIVAIAVVIYVIEVSLGDRFHVPSMSRSNVELEE